VASGSLLGNIAPSAVWITPVSGGQPVALTDNRSLNTSPIWLPRGRVVLFVSNRDGGRDIYRLGLRRSGQPDGSPVRLTTGLNAHTISISADGRRIAYSAYRETSNVWALSIPQGEPVSISQATPATTGDQIIEAVSVSPDGKWLAFDSDRNGNQDIYRMPVAGGEPEQLTTDPQDDFAPAWSPDGKEIAFHSFHNGNRDVFIMPATGGQPEPVVAGPAQERGARWSPDGQHLVFTSNQTGRYELYTVSREGGRWGTPTQLTSDVRSGGGLRFDWSPDGRLIAYIRPRTIEVIPPAGGGPRTVVAAPDLLPQSVFQNLQWLSDRTLVYYLADAGSATGFWSVSLTGGPPRFLVRFDDPVLDFARGIFAVSGNRVYVPLVKRESDIWAAEVVAR